MTPTESPAPEPEQLDWDDTPFVCPECHCIGEEPHHAGCIDGEIEAELNEHIASGDYDLNDSDDWEWEP